MEQHSPGKCDCGDVDLEGRIALLRARLGTLATGNRVLHATKPGSEGVPASPNAGSTELRRLNESLAMASARSAELLTDLEEKNVELSRANLELARANVHGAELMAEIELKNEEIGRLNGALSRANADASELLAELECKNAELEELNETLKRTSDEKSRLLGVAAHDLRGGIGGMSGLADLLDDTLTSPGEEAGELISAMREEGRRLLDLLSSLLDVSRVEQGRLDLNPERLPLATVVGHAVRFHRRFAENKNQRIRVVYPKSPVVVMADSLRIRQVLDNLISNAVKYAPHGTRICVTIEAAGGGGVVRVLDEGPGLTNADLAKVFKFFSPLSARPTGGESSHGLGLAIARKVVEAHAGRIWCENRSGGPGACFAFSLPMAGAGVSAGEGGEDGGGAGWVLVADEGAVNRKLAKRLLEKHGYCVDVVESGKDAIAATTKRTYDLMLLDIDVDRSIGLEATAAIRAAENGGRRMAILGLTEDITRDKEEQTRGAGMDGCLRKPLDPQTVSEALRRWIA